MPAKRHSAVAASRLAAVKKSKTSNKSDEGFFLNDDEDENQADKTTKSNQLHDTQDQQEEEEARETAEEKRLRLAREYLAKLAAHAEDDLDQRKGVTGGSDDEASDLEEGQPASKSRLAQLLHMDAAQAAGRVQRHLASAITMPHYDDPVSSGRGRRGHRLAPTAIALSYDDSTAWTVAKDGSICKWDIATGKRTQLTWQGQGSGADTPAADTGPDWVKKAARSTSRQALNAVAVSSDGALLAVGGGDRKIHVFDARTDTYIQSYPGHRDAISALAFREGTHNLFSGSFDRTIKMWSLDDRAYMDTLFGHQAEILSLDVMRAERVVSSGSDRSCRVWKIPEESQLIFRHAAAGAAQTIECCRYLTGTDWISGTSDGCIQAMLGNKMLKITSLQRMTRHPAVQHTSPFAMTRLDLSAVRLLFKQAMKAEELAVHESGCSNIHDNILIREVWTQLKRKPVSVVHNAHGPAKISASSTETAGAVMASSALSVSGLPPDVTGWVQSVATARGSDLVASGAGDGAIRLWEVTSGKAGGISGLKSLGSLPARGWVNGLAIARSGKFVVAAVGQEPRLGRWARDGAARNGLLIHQLVVQNQNV